MCVLTHSARIYSVVHMKRESQRKMTESTLLESLQGFWTGNSHIPVHHALLHYWLAAWLVSMFIWGLQLQYCRRGFNSCVCWVCSCRHTTLEWDHTF